MNVQTDPQQTHKSAVGIVCLGLMGGSFARALHAGGRAVFAWNRNRQTLEFAQIDTIDGELTDEKIAHMDLIILAGYPKQALSWLQEKAPLISSSTLVMDVGGTKREVCERGEALARHYGFTFIGCHPMAGTQFSGFAHARANMYEGAPLVVVPPQGNSELENLKLIDRLSELLEPCHFGSITPATAAEHDKMIAYTSQLAHVVSNAYVKSPSAQQHQGFSAGSYKDLTRVAQLNADMWTELFLENADNLGAELDCLIENLKAYKQALAAGDATQLHELLAEGDRLKRAADAEASGRPVIAAGSLDTRTV